MNYLVAKLELQEQTPKVSFTMLATEAVAVVAIAGILVQVFI